MRKSHRTFLDAARALGATVIGIEYGGVHLRARLSANGRETWVAIPGSPGDRRSILNFKTQVRRWINELDT